MFRILWGAAGAAVFDDAANQEDQRCEECNGDRGGRPPFRHCATKHHAAGSEEDHSAYAAPHASGEERYWDGTRWVEMPTRSPQTQSVTSTAAHPGRGWKVAAITAIIAVGVLLTLWVASLVALGAASRAGQSSGTGVGADSPNDDRATELDAREQDLADREAAVAEREDAVSAWVTTVLNDGIYTIGVSAEAGVYRTETVGEYCQWNICLTGTGIYDVEGTINFGAGEPGPIQVTLEEGQDFSSSDCGAWNRIG